MEVPAPATCPLALTVLPLRLQTGPDLKWRPVARALPVPSTSNTQSPAVAPTSRRFVIVFRSPLSVPNPLAERSRRESAPHPNVGPTTVTDLQQNGIQTSVQKTAPELGNTTVSVID
jgi:hypothetical protein